MKRTHFLMMTVAGISLLTGCGKVNKTVLQTAPATAGGSIVMQTGMAENEDAYAAGRTAAEQLVERLNGVAPHAVMMMDCFDSAELKQQAIAGVSSVIDSELIFGGAVYGVYTQDGATNVDGISLLALAGDGLQVQAALVENMGASKLSIETQHEMLAAKLNAGGAAVASKLVNPAESDLIILMGDAHSPKNQLLLDGLQTVVGKEVAVTGGSISKNDGLNYVYYRGAMYRDSAIAVALKGDLVAGQAGRQAKSNDEVISTAKEGAATAMKAVGRKAPIALIAYDCAGRMGKLDNLSDEVNIIKTVVSSSIPIFGTYCAGEFGAADTTLGETVTGCVGRGWHAMFTVLGK